LKTVLAWSFNVHWRAGGVVALREDAVVAEVLLVALPGDDEVARGVHGDDRGELVVGGC